MSTTIEVTGAVSLAGVGVAVCALVYLHRAPSGLSPIRSAVSQYGITPYRSGYRATTISMGVSSAALAIALRSVGGAGMPTVVALLGVFSLSRFVISWFPMDAPGSTRTSTGAAHGLLALATFVSVAIAALRLDRVLDDHVAWATLAKVSQGLGWAMVVCLGLIVLSRTATELRRAFGAIERLLYVAIIAWLVVIGVACATGQL